jgi:hypothetical protein
LDVIFTIVSRNYAAQAATLMESLALAEPKARRVIVATDGPNPALEAFAEVIDAGSVGAPFAAMCVYYDALELNTAVKPYVFKHLLSQPGVTSATYLDPDIYVYRPLDGVREGLAQAQLVLTPHVTRPLLGDANPNDQAILRSGVYNLGFVAGRAEPKVLALMSWWADRCEFDCRVDLPNGLFTDQKWMDMSPGFVDSVAIHRAPDMNLAYWNLEGRTLAKTKAGWTVDGQPLTFFHFSGFDPHLGHGRLATGGPAGRVRRGHAAQWPRHNQPDPLPAQPLRLGPPRFAADAPPCAARGAGRRGLRHRPFRRDRGLVRRSRPRRRRAGPAGPDPADGAGLARESRDRPLRHVQRRGPPRLPPVVRRQR